MCVEANAGWFRSARASSKPSTRGMSTSLTTASGGVLAGHAVLAPRVARRARLEARRGEPAPPSCGAGSRRRPRRAARSGTFARGRGGGAALATCARTRSRRAPGDRPARGRRRRARRPRRCSSSQRELLRDTHQHGGATARLRAERARELHVGVVVREPVESQSAAAPPRARRGRRCPGRPRDIEAGGLERGAAGSDGDAARRGR